MAKQATETEQVWFRDNETYVAMRRWVSEFTGKPAGEWNIFDVKLAIMVDYPGSIDGFIDDFDNEEIR